MTKNKFLELSPMLLQEVDKPFNSKDYLYELKFDGVRALVFIDKGRIIIKSRRGIILNNIYPELLNIKNITNKTCVFDGEIVLMDKGKPSFTKLQERVRLKDKIKINKLSKTNPVVFVVFDILYLNKDLTKLPLIKRKEILNRFKDTNEFIKSKVYSDGIKLFNLVKKEGLEGIISKKKNSLYEYSKRSENWVKIKNFKENQFYISGYLNNKNNTTISIVLTEKKNHDYYFVGKCIMGRKNNLFNKILNSKKVKKYINGYNADAIFINPEYKIRIKYIERTKNNMLRQPFIDYLNK